MKDQPRWRVWRVGVQGQHSFRPYIVMGLGLEKPFFYFMVLQGALQKNVSLLKLIP